VTSKDNGGRLGDRKVGGASKAAPDLEGGLAQGLHMDAPGSDGAQAGVPQADREIG
jgi:hypothetical protein